MKLIYHLPDNDGNNKKPSPFDIAIKEIVKDKVIQIACPYISLSYFKKLISECKENDWKLLTDADALVNSQGREQAEKIVDFLEEFRAKIKDQNGLHAKVIIAENSALLGSANFTENGIYNNNEVSIIINDVKKINELKEWYNQWWPHAKELTDEKLIELRERAKNIENREIEYRKSGMPHTSYLKEIENSQIQTEAKNIVPNKDDEERLVEYLTVWDDKTYTEQYCDLAKYLIERFNINEHDERLSISFGTGRYNIPLTIGQRWVLLPAWEGRGVGLIMPLNFDEENAWSEGWGGHRYTFKTNRQDDAAWIHYFKETGEIEFNDITIYEWEKALEYELNRTKKSGFRKFNRPTLYKFICDKEYRKYILDKV